MPSNLRIEASFLQMIPYIVIYLAPKVIKMKRVFLIFSAISFSLALSYCSSSKKAKAAPAVTYETNVQQIITAHCSPCHFPGKGGKKTALDSYAAVKYNINDIVFRVEMHPGEQGFMPFKRDRLEDSVINLLKTWQESGTALK